MRNTNTTARTANTKAAFEAAMTALAKAGALEAKAGKAIAEAKVEQASAQDIALAAMTTKGVLSLTFTYDVKDNKGEIIEHVKSAKLSDYAAGFTKEGKEYRAKSTAFRGAVLARFFNVPADSDSVWAMFRQVFPSAMALVGEAMTATVGNDGKLVISGGKGESAKKLRDAAAKSTKELNKVAKGEAGKRKVKTPGEGEGTVPATLTDLLTAVRNFLDQSVRGRETDYAPNAVDVKLIRDIVVLGDSYVDAVDPKVLCE
jgi:hypothetical protein